MIYINEFIDRNSESCVIMHSLPGSSLYRGNTAGRVDTGTGQRLFRGEGDMMEREEEEIERRENQQKRHYFYQITEVGSLIRKQNPSIEIQQFVKSYSIWKIFNVE